MNYHEILALNHAGLYEPVEILAMANVYSDKKNKITIQINPDRNRRGLPYFKVYNHYSYKIASKMARISIHEPKYIHHRNSGGKQFWKLNSKDRQVLMNCLTLKPIGKIFTVWQLLIIAFNDEKLGVVEGDTISINKSNYFSYKETLKLEGYEDLTDLLPFDLPMPNYLLLE